MLREGRGPALQAAARGQGRYRVHVDQPAGLLARVLHPLKPKLRIHPVRTLAPLQALESGERGAIVPRVKGA